VQNQDGVVVFHDHLGYIRNLADGELELDGLARTDRQRLEEEQREAAAERVSSAIFWEPAIMCNPVNSPKK
jgi:hypothetical protein